MKVINSASEGTMTRKTIDSLCALFSCKMTFVACIGCAIYTQQKSWDPSVKHLLIEWSPMLDLIRSFPHFQDINRTKGCSFIASYMAMLITCFGSHPTPYRCDLECESLHDDNSKEYQMLAAQRCTQIGQKNV